MQKLFAPARQLASDKNASNRRVFTMAGGEAPRAQSQGMQISRTLHRKAMRSAGIGSFKSLHRIEGTRRLQIYTRKMGTDE